MLLNLLLKLVFLMLFMTNFASANPISSCSQSFGIRDFIAKITKTASPQTKDIMSLVKQEAKEQAPYSFTSFQLAKQYIQDNYYKLEFRDFIYMLKNMPITSVRQEDKHNKEKYQEYKYTMQYELALLYFHLKPSIGLKEILVITKQMHFNKDAIRLLVMFCVRNKQLFYDLKNVKLLTAKLSSFSEQEHDNALMYFAYVGIIHKKIYTNNPIYSNDVLLDLASYALKASTQDYIFSLMDGIYDPPVFEAENKDTYLQAIQNHTNLL